MVRVDDDRCRRGEVKHRFQLQEVHDSRIGATNRQVFNTTITRHRARSVNHGPKWNLLAHPVGERQRIRASSAIVGHAAAAPLLTGRVLQSQCIITNSAIDHQLTHAGPKTIRGRHFQQATANAHRIMSTQHVKSHTGKWSRLT